MNSFTLRAIGQLARNPETGSKDDTTYVRFCLIGNDYLGQDESDNAREATTSLWFVAFNTLGEAIARHARKGDQLIVEACIRSNTWIDKEGETQYSESYIVQGYGGSSTTVTDAEHPQSQKDHGHIRHELHRL